MWEEVGDHLPTFTVGLEVPLRSDHPTFVSLASPAEGLDVYGLAVEGVKVGLVVEGIGVAGASVHEEEYNRLRLSRKGRVLGGKRVDVFG